MTIMDELGRIMDEHTMAFFFSVYNAHKSFGWYTVLSLCEALSCFFMLVI